MSKRALVALLWFAAVWVSYEVVWSVTGVPRIVGPVVAAAIAAAVAIDPAGAWRSRGAPGSTPIGAASHISLEH